MNPIVSYTLNNNVATITMDDGKANVISPTMVAELNAALDRAEQDEAVVVLEGRAGMFSGGFDLSVMSEGVEPMVALVRSGSELARRLLAFPCPVIGASSGHAVAMGAFLLLSCDYRIGLSGDFKYGLNEVAIGLTMHHVGTELARGRLTRRHFNRAVMNAEMFSPQAAVDAGFIDEVVDQGGYDAALQRQAGALLALNRQAFSNTKRKARKAFLDTVDRAISQDSEDFKKMMASAK